MFLSPETTDEVACSRLRFLERICAALGQHLERQPTDAGSAAEAGLARLGLELQQSLRVKDVAAVAANNGRLLVGCDRVSVLVERGRKVSLLAASGAASVSSRANLVRTMTQLGTLAIRAGEAIEYDGRPATLSPPIETALAEFLQESGSRMVHVIPLLAVAKPSESDSREPELRQAATPKPFGCLIVEQMTDVPLAPDWEQKARTLARHVAPPLYNSLGLQAIFLLPVWRACGDLLESLHGRRLAKAAAAAAAMLLVTLTLICVPWSYRISGTGRLMPVTRSEVFVPIDGEVTEVFVRGGDRVVAGQPLVKLKNSALQAELIEVRGQLLEKRQLAQALSAQWDDVIRGAKREDEIRLQSQAEEARVQIHSLAAHLAVLQEREKLLDIRAPLAGVIATFQVEQLLSQRPVRRGEALMEVMDDNGRWQLELEVPENRMGHLLTARNDQNHKPQFTMAGVRKGTPRVNASGSVETAGQRLPVKFMLATEPERDYQGEVIDVSTRAVAAREGGQVVEVLAAVDETQLAHPRIGAEVTAKIHCGRRVLGYVLFGDVIDFIRKYLWI